MHCIERISFGERYSKVTIELTLPVTEPWPGSRKNPISKNNNGGKVRSPWSDLMGTIHCQVSLSSQFSWCWRQEDLSYT